MSAADDVSEGVPKDTAYTITEAPQQQCTDDAGGDAANAAPAAPTTGPMAPTAVPSAGGSDIAGVDEQCLVDTPEAPYSAPTSLAPTDTNKQSDERRYSSAPSRGNNPPVLYVRVPVGQQYPPPEYYHYEQPYRGSWGGGRGPWGGGGGRANRFVLPDNGDWEDAGSFSEATVRRAFIRKVYAILSLQLAFTLGIIAIFMFEPNVKQFVLSHGAVIYIALVLFAVVYVTLVCCGDIRRRHPYNAILLFIFTLSLSYVMGALTATFNVYIVFMAVAMTTIIALVVTLLATFSKVDMTGCGALLCVLTLGTFVFFIFVMLVSLIAPGGRYLMTGIYGGLVCILFSLYLMYETQLIMGGRYMELSPEEHILAALLLYVDIVYIFWGLLLLLGSCFSK